MDVIRRCYTTKMRFFEDSDVEIPVQWYFAHPDAKVFPKWHRFASGNWARDKDFWTGPGEASWRPRPWSDGEPPGPPTITPFGNFPLERTIPVGNSYTTTGGINEGAGVTIICWVWSYAIVGSGVITSIVDSSGNIFTRDLVEVGVVDPKVTLDVWRLRCTSNFFNSKLTINLPGSISFLSIGAAGFFGMLDQAPIVTTTKRGVSGTNPSLGPVIPRSLSQLIFATFSCGALASVTSVPPSFVDLGSSTTNGVKEDGNASYRILEKKVKLPNPAWVAHTNYEWVAGGLIYQGIPRPPMPGKEACGKLAYYQEGAPTSFEPPATDIWGVSRCCLDGDWPFELGCNMIRGDAVLTINAIYDHGPSTLTHVGQKIRLLWHGGPGWDVDPLQFSEVGGGFLGFGVVCGPAGFSLQTPGVFGVTFPAITARNNPPGVTFWFVYPIPLPSADGNEKWDVTITPAYPI